MESQRLKFRRFNAGDLQNMTDLEADPAVMKFTPSRVPLSLEKTRQRLHALIERESSLTPLGVWAVEMKETKEFVAWVMLLKTQHEFPELGFMVVRRFWGQGFATEAAQRLVEYGFHELGMPAIVATTDQDNTASKHVLQKLGFQYSKTVVTTDKNQAREVNLDVFELRKT